MFGYLEMQGRESARTHEPWITTSGQGLKKFVGQVDELLKFPLGVLQRRHIFAAI
jgi:hypothetical protein